MKSMNAVEFVDWLKQENLFDTVNANYKSFQPLIKDCLNIKKETVLILGDVGYPTRRIPALLLGCYLLAAKRLSVDYKLVIQEPIQKGQPASDEVIDALLNLHEEGAIIWALSGKVGSMDVLGNSFRRFVHSHKHRFMSTPGLGVLETKSFPQFVDAINIDYKKMQERGKKLKEALDSGSEVRVTTDKGTNVVFDVKLKASISNDANFQLPDSGGNIPAGEVYIPPRKKGVDGTIVIDGSSKNMDGTLVVKKPIKLTVENGMITSIEGGDEAKALEKSLQWAEQKAKYPWGIRRVGELGIGINPGAKITNSTIISEKTLGTAHVGIGSNYWFGGTVYAIIHLDQVFRSPNIWVDDKKIEIK